MGQYRAVYPGACRRDFRPANRLRELMKTYMCVICGFIYEEEKGLPEEGIPPGTCWEDIPPTWTCPECSANKEDFEVIEI